MSVAVVTGAARGIGAATVDALVRQGWNVVAIDIVADLPELAYPMASPTELDEVVRRNGGPTRVRPIRGDVRDLGVLTRAVEFAMDAWGGLDAAIACAGAIGGGVPSWEVPRSLETVIVEINLFGVLNLARAAVPAMLRRPDPRHGRFVAVSSAASESGLAGVAAYSASKSGVNGAVRALAAELAGTGVTANAVSPGSTATPILSASADLYGLETPDVFADGQPIGRLLDPSEIADVIAFIAGPLSVGMTGAIVHVDGGMTL